MGKQGESTGARRPVPSAGLANPGTMTAGRPVSAIATVMPDCIREFELTVKSEEVSTKMCSSKQDPARVSS